MQLIPDRERDWRRAPGVPDGSSAKAVAKLRSKKRVLDRTCVSAAVPSTLGTRPVFPWRLRNLVSHTSRKGVTSYYHRCVGHLLTAPDVPHGVSIRRGRRKKYKYPADVSSSEHLLWELYDETVLETLLHNKSNFLLRSQSVYDIEG